MATISDLLWILVRRKAVLAAAALASIAAAVCVIHFEPRVFEARAVLESADPYVPVVNLVDDALVASVAGKCNVDASSSWWDRWLASGPLPRLGAVKRNLSVREDPRRVLEIRYDSADPQMAARFANALARSVIERDILARKSAARDSMNALRAHALAVETQLARDRAALRADPPRADLLRDRVEANRRIYESLLEQINRAAMAPEANVRLIAAAQPPLEPVRPDVALQLTLAVFSGLALGMLAAVAREKGDSKIRGPESAGGVGVLAAIPPGSQKRPPLPRSAEHRAHRLGSQGL